MKSTSKMPGIAQIKEMRQDLKSTSPTNCHMNHFSTVFPTPALTSSKSLHTHRPTGAFPTARAVSGPASPLLSALFDPHSPPDLHHLTALLPFCPCLSNGTVSPGLTT